MREALHGPLLKDGYKSRRMINLILSKIPYYQGTREKAMNTLKSHGPVRPTTPNVKTEKESEGIETQNFKGHGSTGSQSTLITPSNFSPQLH